MNMNRHWFYVKQGGITVASGNAATREEAEREAFHYALIYGQDGPVKVSFRSAGQSDEQKEG